ncbi:hypothetical protein LCGC14_2677370, partial [marine sediment metagenome]
GAVGPAEAPDRGLMGDIGGFFGGLFD